jgi:hypothetical protein
MPGKNTLKRTSQPRPSTLRIEPMMVGRKYTTPSTAINGNQNQGLCASAFMSAASR